MLVKDVMTPNPICGRPEMPVTELQAKMNKKNIRHLPIVDAGGNLVGLVTQRSLLSALRTDESDLSQFEVSYILKKIKAHHVMVTNIITIDEDVPIEEAARIMADKHIGCLPVMRASELVGIITDNDLFSAMLNLLGARRSGIRVAILQPDRMGEVARLTSAIAQKGGYLSVCVGYYPEEETRDTWISLLKVSNIPKDELVALINGLGDAQVQDVREV
ncbi:MAG: CBS domain-containing protein [Anaerolineae bacterium]|nr:CBS domain-containing protein [Anaerolineae bacterium]